jgi:hypothetical protein
MNPRHAAALALVGWYLMSAPLVGNRPDVKARFSKWTIEHVFDSARDCDTLRGRWRERASRITDAVNQHTKLSPEDAEVTIEALYEMGSCECVASDDPRLKEK